MSALPRLSVIVPVFNGGKTLNATISSLLMVDYPTDRLQILIVDNHSSDATPQLIQSYPRVEYAFEGHRTSYAARNKGGLRAVGDILAFTDGDCTVSPGWARAGVTTLLENPDVHLVGGPVGVGPTDTPMQQFLQRAGNNNPRSSMRKGYFPTANLFVRREVFDHLGGFDERMASGGDLDFCWRARYAGYRLGFSDECAVFHQHRDTQKSMYRQAFKYGYGSRTLREKHSTLAEPTDEECARYFRDTSITSVAKRASADLQEAWRHRKSEDPTQHTDPLLRFIRTSAFLAGAVKYEYDARAARGRGRK